jgi:hypothetical protein
MKRIQTAPVSGRKKLFAILTGLVFIAFSFGRVPGSAPGPGARIPSGFHTGDTLKKIPPELLREDFTVFRDSMVRIHAGLYRYKDKKVLDKQFDSCWSGLDHPMTVMEYFPIISFLVSSVEDGHTECFPPAETIDYLKENAKIFPVQFRLIKNKAFIPCNTKEFPAGTEVISIDHEPVHEIAKRLFHYLPSDGNIGTGKYTKLNDGHDPFFYVYYYVYGEKSSFAVDYRIPAEKPQTIQLPADVFKNLECIREPDKIGKYLRLEYRPRGIGILTLKSFSGERLLATKENFRSFLTSSFQEIKDKKIKKLIIDLRDNGGGDDDNGAFLYSFLTSKPFHYYASLETTTRKIQPGEDHLLEMQSPGSHPFTGKVWFLINGGCFSGTAEFSSVARSNARGKFIGEETGGGYYGNTSGSKFTLILPNTKIRINIPRVRYTMDVKKAMYNDRGIIPDYPLTPSIGDYIQNKDVQMEFALRLAHSFIPSPSYRSVW